MHKKLCLLLQYHNRYNGSVPHLLFSQKHNDTLHNAARATAMTILQQKVPNKTDIIEH